MIVRPFPPPPPKRVPDTVGGTWIDYLIWAFMLAVIAVGAFFLCVAMFG